MLKQDDLEAAVAAGVITEAQADALNDIASARRKPRAFAVGRDERFRLLGGFNDFFIAVGVVLLGFGLLLGWSKDYTAPLFLLGIITMWGLAEYLTGALRLTAPSIVISIFLALFAFWAATALLGEIVSLKNFETWVYPALAALVVTAMHYLRFRLPFSLLVGAVVLLLAVTSAAVAIDLKAKDWASWIVFIYGIAIFTVAMRFDMTDRERLTRRADSGFWLHLAAAPMIVHPLVSFMSKSPSNDGTGAILVVAMTIVLALIALLIDRRALVVVALSYLGGAIAYGVTKVAGLSGSGSVAVLITLIFLGTVVIALGVGWRRIRGALLRTIPAYSFKLYLPPYAEHS